MWYSLLRPLLFKLEPETAHDLTLSLLKVLSTLQPSKPVPQKNQLECFGLKFSNPVGLAAGLDKDGQCMEAWQNFGFGFIELGTVTPKPQFGNPRPRLFRLASDQAIINRMGFNNLGVDALCERLSKLRKRSIIGVNIGKNRDTAFRDALSDYRISLQKVLPLADYVTINVSSPNTPELRDLQHKEHLQALCQPLIEDRANYCDKTAKYLPILVKLAPDLSDEQLKETLDCLLQLKVDGIIIANTSIQKQKLLPHRTNLPEGGLSGRPLFELNTEMVSKTFKHVKEALPIVAVGGILSAQDAQAKFSAGAKLVQLYTGLIYQGTGLVTKILDTLDK